MTAGSPLRPWRLLATHKAECVLLLQAARTASVAVRVSDVSACVCIGGEGESEEWNGRVCAEREKKERGCGGVVWCGDVWCGVVCVVWCGVVWCGGVVMCGVVWCGVVWCGVW